MPYLSAVLERLPALATSVGRYGDRGLGCRRRNSRPWRAGPQRGPWKLAAWSPKPAEGEQQVEHGVAGRRAGRRTARAAVPCGSARSARARAGRRRPHRGGPGAAARSAASRSSRSRVAGRRSASGARTASRRSASASGSAPHDQLGEVVPRVSTGSSSEPRSSNAAVRTARSYDDRASRPRTRRTDHGLIALRARAAGAAGPRPSMSGTRSSESGCPPSRSSASSPGRSSPTSRVSGAERREHAADLGRGQQHRGQGRRRRASPRARRAATSTSGAAPGEQVLAQPLAVALPDPPAGRQLVGVPGDAGGGQLVDVGEHQLGELRHRAAARRPAAAAASASSRQATRAPTR